MVEIGKYLVPCLRIKRKKMPLNVGDFPISLTGANEQSSTAKRINLPSIVSFCRVTRRSCRCTEFQPVAVPNGLVAEIRFNNKRISGTLVSIISIPRCAPLTLYRRSLNNIWRANEHNSIQSQENLTVNVRTWE